MVLGITFVSDVQFTPHYDFQFLSLLQDFFWAMDFQPCLYFAKIARELLAASTSLWSAEAFMGKLWGPSIWAPPTHTAISGPVLNGGLLYVDPGYTLYR